MNWTLPKITNSDYGRLWPEGTSQLTKELAGFRMNGKEGYESRHRHGLRIIQILWPSQVAMYKIRIDYRTGEKVVIWNTFFMRIFKACCEEKRVALAGSSSSGKTFAVAVYALLLFMSNPKNTTVMISTTAGTDAERRVWGEIKELHEAINEDERIGTLIDYQKVITFDPGKELMNKRTVEGRDVGSGIILIPIPEGQDGQKALGKVIGTKQKDGTVCWIIDELPNMMRGTLRAETNLLSNPFFQCIGIGNSNTKEDEHGQMCEPMGGWDSITDQMDEWDGIDGRTKVLFLHGERGPNHHPAIDSNTKEISDLPFPYLSNRIFLQEAAIRAGRGNAELGRNTIDFWRFGIGYWAGSSVSNTIISSELVKSRGAEENAVRWGDGALRKIAGFDPGWTSGGDFCEMMVGTMGRDTNGRQMVLTDPETIRFIAMIDGKGAGANEEFRKSIAKQVVAYCKKEKIAANDFGMDISGDGGLMMKEIISEWGTSDIIGLSSLEKTDQSDRFDNRVTQYWFQVADAINTGRVRGFSTVSRYFKDFSKRTYETVGKGIVKIQQKRLFKKAYGHSPDSGDSCAYLFEMIKRAGFSFEWHEPKAIKKPYNDPREALRARSEASSHGSYGNVAYAD